MKQGEIKLEKERPNNIGWSRDLSSEAVEVAKRCPLQHHFTISDR